MHNKLSDIFNGFAQHQAGVEAIESTLTCECLNKCAIPNDNVAYAPALGDFATKVMIIAQSPSKGNRKNYGKCFIPGKFIDFRKHYYNLVSKKDQYLSASLIDQIAMPPLLYLTKDTIYIL